MSQDFQLTEYNSIIMFEEVKNLFIAEYGVEHIGKNGEFFELFYNSDFQSDKAIAIVALHDGKVCAFQAFFYWPYIFEGRKLNTFQSGNSLVHPSYRGKGLFSLMLKHIELLAVKRGVDFLIGFPVQMSYGSFLRAGWINSFDLIWRIKLINLHSIFNSKLIDLSYFELLDENKLLDDATSKDTFRLDSSIEFVTWRNSLRSYRKNRVYTYVYSINDNKVQFELKPNYRGRIKEIVIGNVSSNCRDPVIIRNAFNELVKIIRLSNVTILSICINDFSNDNLIKSIIDSMAFLGIKKKIHFIINRLNCIEEFDNPKFWKIFRSDVDTW